MQQLRIQESIQKRPIPRPLVNICLSFMTGIVYGYFYPFPFPVGLAIITGLMVCWILSSQKRFISPRSRFHRVMALLLFFFIGAIRMEYQYLQQSNLQRQVHELTNDAETTVHGIVQEIETIDSETKRILLADLFLIQESRRTNFPGKVLLYGPTSLLETFQPGDRLETQGQILPTEGARIPAHFDTQLHRHSQSILGSMYYKPTAPLVRTVPTTWRPVRGFAYRLIDAFQQRLTARESGILSINNKDHSSITGLVASICFGLRSMTPPDVSEDLRRSGLAHLTSISGLHVTIVLMGMVYGLKRMGLTRRQSMIVTGIFSLYYLTLVGFRVPAIRATSMAFVLMGQYFVERKVDSLNSLAFAALCILFVSPVELFLPSFQLSFLAVFLLLIFMYVDTFMRDRIRSDWLLWATRGLFVSCLISVCFTPLNLYYFHQAGWGAIVGNLFAIPIVTCLLPVSYCWSASVLIGIPYLEPALHETLASLSRILLTIIQTTSRIDLLHFERASLPLQSTILSTAAILLMSNPGNKLFDRYGLAIRTYQISLLCLALAVWFPSIIRYNSPLTLHFLSLGQGDCTIIQTPDQRTLIVDGGPPARNPRRPSSLTRFLRDQGILSIDALFLSHPQADHIGVFNEVVEQFEIKQFFEGYAESSTQTYQELRDSLSRKSIPRTSLKHGDRIQVGESLTFWVLHPAHEEIVAPDEEVNEQSLVLMMEYSNRRVLFTGDIGVKTEMLLAERLDDWDIDVLKVSHHGSRYSSSPRFIDETDPEFGIIHVGTNPYGHPHETILKRYLDHSTCILRTDLDGTVRMSIWNNAIQAYTSRSGRLFVLHTRS